MSRTAKRMKSYPFYLLFSFVLILSACTSGNDSGAEETGVENLPRPRVSITTSYGELVFELFNEFIYAFEFIH